jgi:CheY-like chemotaxis protein/HPt (histidine-containing phosphotransfer) domain-containing protein
MNPTLPCGLLGDEIRLRQIINNLLSNAVKYTNEGTVELTLDYERSSDASIELHISVRDTGIGIKKEDIDKLFESFTRVDEKRNSNIEGTGLGLNLTKNLVDLMKGQIKVSSVYNHGSVFEVQIPQIIKNWAPVGDFSKRYKEAMLQKDTDSQIVYAPEARLLLVDDVQMNLLVAKGLLKYTGAQVDIAESGQEAIKLVTEQKYDLIFMDHLMPVMDGIECLHKIKEMGNHPNVATPIIILTANAIIGAREEYIKAGFTDYLAKPIREKELQNMLLKYLPEDMVEIRKKESLTRNQKKENSRAGGVTNGAGADNGAVGSGIGNGRMNGAIPETDGVNSGRLENGGYGNRVQAAAGNAWVREADSAGEGWQAAGETGMPQGYAGAVGDGTPQPAELQGAQAAEDTPLGRLAGQTGLDTGRGLRYCMNDTALYMQLLQEYTKTPRGEELNDYFAKEDWRNYRIAVHALKSASLTIGAAELSDQAEALETACKQNDTDYIKTEHEKLLGKYEELKAAIAGCEL